MINAAVVGMGWWGKQMVNCLQKGSDKISLACAVDTDPAAVKAFTDEKGVRLVTNVQDVLDDPAVDALILCLPHSIHEEYILRCAAAGKQVFCEKPLCLTKESAERAVAACEKAGVMLGIGHERRYEGPMVEIKRMIDAGELGTLMHAEANFSHDKFAVLDAGNWRGSTEEAPAAGMTGMGIHLTDAYINMMGPVAEVHAITAKRVLPLPTGDIVSVQFRFESGATGYLCAISATPFYGKFTVFGSDAWVEARDDEHPEAGGVTHLTVCRAGGKPETTDYEPLDTVLANLEAFADAAEGRGDYQFTRAQKIANVAVLEAITESAKTGSPVRLADL